VIGTEEPRSPDCCVVESLSVGNGRIVGFEE